MVVGGSLDRLDPAMNIMKYIEDAIAADDQNDIETETLVPLIRRVMHEVT